MDINVRATPVFIILSTDIDGHKTFQAVELSARKAIGTAATVINNMSADYMGGIIPDFELPFKVEILVTRFGLVRCEQVDHQLTERAYRESRVWRNAKEQEGQ